MRIPLLLALALAVLVGDPEGHPGIPTFTLTVNITGSRAGTVVVAGAGATCSGAGTTCQFQIGDGTPVEIAASSPAGQAPGVLTGGTNAAAGCGTSTCRFSMGGTSDITAVFNDGNGPAVSLGVTLAGDGTASVALDGVRCQSFGSAAASTCARSYMLGSISTLTAQSLPASRFTGFAGAGCGSAPSCTLPLNGSAGVTATFRSLTGITVAPLTAAHRAGEQQTFTATGVYSDAVTSRLDVGNGDWTIGAGMPSSRYNLAAASSGGRLYAFGGLDVTVPSNAAAVYDPALDAWLPLPGMPTAREGLAVAAVSGAVYAIGGNTAGNVPLTAVERFDPTTGSWSGRAPMPTARRYLSTAVVNGIIYAIGGEIDDGVQATSVGTVEAYDPSSNTWTARAPMPTPRRFFAAAAVNGRIYAAGGDDGRSTFTLIEEYDPASDTWQQLTVWIPELLIRPAGAGIGGALYVAGLVNNGTRVAAYQYDVYNQMWTEKSDVPTTRRGPAVVSMGNTLYVAGGRTQEGVPVNTLEAFVEPLTWSSSDLRVAAVATSACNPALGSPVCLGAGTATALALGTATITATAGTVTCGLSCGTMSVTPAQIAIELPANGASVGPGFQLSGWALNRDATSGTGVDAVHVYAAPNGGNAIFLGVATYGTPRPDIAALFGNQFLNSGFTLGPTAPLAPGGYTITAYAHNAVTGQFDATASVAVTVSAPASHPAMAIDTPAASQQVAAALEVSGWTLDLGAASGTGVDAVHVYVFPSDGAGAPMFAGQAAYGLARPDVGAIFGAPFTNCGYHLTVSGLSPGAYLLAVIAHSTVTSSFSIVGTVHFRVITTAVMTIDTPADLSATAAPVLTVAGWSIDRSASVGTGVDALHVYAFPNPGSGQAPIFLGVAAMGMARPDVGAIYGAQFTSAGYGLTVTRASAGLGPGPYAIVVASHSTTTGTFNNVAIARVTLQ